MTRLSEYLNRNRLAGAVDLVAWPGGAVALTNNDRDIVLGALHTAVTMHEPAEIVLTVHRDCAKLGGSGTFAGPLAESAVLEQTLGLAAAVAAAEFPALHISLVRLNDRHAAVEYAPTRPSVTRT
ncbi:MAG: hypothetical protein SGJ13_05770 [Actinomycetota bacterium]|nr:hypothetical protein [Actinomycetota bacterium]